jgi:outer membrane protein OmpA-like peptidoglycan-associated protein
MRKIIVLVMVSLAIGSLSCAASKGQKGAGIGAGVGALAGAVIGHQSGNTAAGAVIGGVTGGVAGAIIGDYMDKQASEMKDDLSGAKVERAGDGINVTFGAGILFDVDKYELRPDARTEIARMAEILAKYPDTYVRIEGHTDSDGSESHNQTLSERRASAVTAYLTEQNISVGRLKSFGFGETRPVASNETPDGKQANRRVEVIIEPNEELRRQAEEKAKEQG